MLLNIENHISLLDDFAGENLINIKEEYKEKYSIYLELEKSLRMNYGDEKEKTRKLDLLKFELNELESVKLKENEEEELNAKRKILQNSSKIDNSLNISEIELENKVITGLSISIKELEKIGDINDKYKNLLNILKNSYYEIEETKNEIAELKEEIVFDKKEQEETEERLNTVFSLKRKYGNTIIEILEYKEKLKKEIERIENLDIYINELKNKKEKIEEEMKIICKNMNEIREKFAKEIEIKITKELQELEMKDAEFKVKNIFEDNKNFTINGLNKIEFLIKTNYGDLFKPLSKIASGGEMSRCMLAIKTILAEVDNTPILIFDEIDTGISGIAAKAVSSKLKCVSKSHQVICITHLAVIAAKGDHNYFIKKEHKEDKTITNVKSLNEEEIIKEIARISSGNVTDISLKHAKELRQTA